MLHVPSIKSPIADLVRPLLQDVMITSAELAAHWRQSRDYAANMRRAARGPAYVKLPHGAIRYRLSDVLAYELSGQRGVTPQVVRLACETMDWLPPRDRERIASCVIDACYPSAAHQ